MFTPGEFEQRMWQIVESIAPNRVIEFEWKTIPEARLHKSKLTQAQKQLRLLKSEVTQTKRDINAAYSAKSASIGKGVGSFVAGGLLGRRNVGKMNSLSRQAVRSSQLDSIAPYERVNHQIDSVLHQFDQLKLQLDSWIVENA